MNVYAKKAIIFLCIITLIACNSNSADEDSVSTENNCIYENGIHSATVDYFNPDTGHSNTYVLDIEVEDCRVIQINFPNGGWLDETHLSPEELDENGDASIVDDRGRTFDIHIDK